MKKLFLIISLVVVGFAFVSCGGTTTAATTQAATTQGVTTTQAATTTAVGVTTTQAATTGAAVTTTQATTTVVATTTEAIEMDATLTDLSINGITAMGFSPSINDYVVVLTAGVTATPTVSAVKYATGSSVVIVNAVDVTSSLVSDRTTTVTVTTSDDMTTNVYTVIFESTIAKVDLGTADAFVILGETAISTSTSSIITGDVGLSPSAATYITGFSLIKDSSNEFATSAQITGNVYASDYTSPTPTILTTAIADMQLAYTDAAGRTANYNELYSGNLSGKTLTTGVYKFGNGVLINDDLTLTGSATDVWIFQIAGQLTQASTVSITLAGGALAENIFWQVADTVAIGTGAHFEGTILAMTNISFGTNASVNGSLYAQTAITLDACTVIKP